MSLSKNVSKNQNQKLRVTIEETHAFCLYVAGNFMNLVLKALYGEKDKDGTQLYQGFDPKERLDLGKFYFAIVSRNVVFEDGSKKKQIGVHFSSEADFENCGIDDREIKNIVRVCTAFATQGAQNEIIGEVLWRCGFENHEIEKYIEIRKKNFAKYEEEGDSFVPEPYPYKNNQNDINCIKSDMFMWMVDYFTHPPFQQDIIRKFKESRLNVVSRLPPRFSTGAPLISTPIPQKNEVQVEIKKEVKNFWNPEKIKEREKVVMEVTEQFKEKRRIALELLDEEEKEERNRRLALIN